MQMWGFLRFKIIVAFVYISILFAGCQTARVPVVQITETPFQDEKSIIHTQIQSTLNDYNAAVEKNDKTLFMSTIDPEISAVRESFSESFDSIQSSGFPKTVKLGMTVMSIEQKNQNLTLAHIQRDRDHWPADWFFRKTDNKWVLSEPTLAESGGQQTTTSGNYTFITYPIANDVNQKIIALMSKAKEHVLKDLGQIPAGKIEVTIYPFSSPSQLAGSALSSWEISAVANGTDNIYITSPASWRFGFYDPQTGWESDIEMLLTHELGRIAYVRNFGNPGRGADWFFEGLAEYVAGYNEMPEVMAAVQNDAIIPIIDTSSSAAKIDLAHFRNLDNWTLAYGLSESLVTFIVEKYNGLEAFWKLARAYDRSQDMKTAIQDTLGISYEEFDASWRKWLKEDYIKR